ARQRGRSLRRHGPRCAMQYDRLEYADGEARGHAAAPAPPLVLPRLESDALAQLRDEVGEAQRPAIPLEPRLLMGDRGAELDGVGVVREDLRADTVLERRDDLAAGRVVLGVRSEDQRHVQVQSYRVAVHRDVALLHDIEQP